MFFEFKQLLFDCSKQQLFDDVYLVVDVDISFLLTFFFLFLPPTLPDAPELEEISGAIAPAASAAAAPPIIISKTSADAPDATRWTASGAPGSVGIASGRSGVASADVFPHRRSN